MVLVDWQIRKLCEEESLVEPYEPSLINPSSIDIRLGETVLIDSPNGMIDYPDFRNHNENNPYYMEPGEFILASTLEYITVPRNNISLELKLKSSRARECLSHALAGWVENGFHGILTLELKNYSRFQKVKIYPGLRIGQLILHETEEPETDYTQGRYAGHKKVIGCLDKVS